MRGNDGGGIGILATNLSNFFVPKAGTPFSIHFKSSIVTGGLDLEGCAWGLGLGFGLNFLPTPSRRCEPLPFFGFIL
jgi:hypothetical protein